MANKVLIIDDDPDICLLMKRFLEKNGFEVDTAGNGEEAVEKLRKTMFDVALLDYKLPDYSGLEILQKLRLLHNQIQVIIITGYSDLKTAVDTLKHGAFDYVTKPLHPDEILHTIHSALDKISTNKEDLNNAKESKQRTPGKRISPDKFIAGSTDQAQTVIKHIELIAPTDMSVIIVGETGTGKEYVAREIHNKSHRHSEPFVAIDCGALPKELAGSELFGHVKGAFTGALKDKEGSFEQANGGTLFLDEIGNLSYENQIKLLRVLQERKIKRLGDVKDKAIDVRIIVASNESLKEAVKAGKFREDIYHRLNEFKIELSPLRERPSDVLLFARHFLKNANQELNKQVKDIDKEVSKKLKEHYWHGNLRELKNVIKRSVLLCRGDKITLECIPQEILEPGMLAAPENPEDQEFTDLKSVVEFAERKAILKTLQNTAYNKSRTAEILGIDRKTLYNKMKSYDIQA